MGDAARELRVGLCLAQQAIGALVMAGAALMAQAVTTAVNEAAQSERRPPRAPEITVAEKEPRGNWFGDGFRKGQEAEEARVNALLDRVPRVTVASNWVTVRVVAKQ